MLLIKDLEKIKYKYYYKCKKILEDNIDKINWHRLSSNSSAIHILEHNIERIYWKQLSENCKAIYILLNNKDKIDWDYFSDNYNPLAVELILQNIDNIDILELTSNPNPLIVNKILNMNAITKIVTNFVKNNNSKILCNPNNKILKHITKKLLSNLQHILDNDINSSPYIICLNTNKKLYNYFKYIYDKLIKRNSYYKYMMYIVSNNDFVTYILDDIKYSINNISNTSIEYKIISEMLSLNQNNQIIQLLEKNVRFINWDKINMNPFYI